MEEEKGIKIKAILEIMGSPEEHVSKTMNMVIEKIKENKDFEILSEKLADTIKVEDKPFWSKFVELDINFKNADQIMGFCFDFMPSSVELIEAKEIGLNKEAFENMTNDLTARLHQYDMMIRNLHAENVVLKKELKKLNPKPFNPYASENKENKTKENSN
jgi:hypothetical protein